jgi:hypothetical protein
MGRNARRRPRLAPLVAALAGAASILVGPAVMAASDGARLLHPAWAASCGFGRFYTGDMLAFDHWIEFTVAVDADRGYVTDCYAGTEAYFEFQYTTGDGWFVYVVWGQLGDLRVLDNLG